MELLVRVVDKTSDDPYKDCQLTKRGHVIVVKPDGHDWTPTERNNPDWVILQVPDISEAEAGAMLVPEPGDEKNRMLQRRAFKLDIDALTEKAPDIESEAVKKGAVLEIALKEIRAVKTVNPPIPDTDKLP